MTNSHQSWSSLFDWLPNVTLCVPSRPSSQNRKKKCLKRSGRTLISQRYKERNSGSSQDFILQGWNSEKMFYKPGFLQPVLECQKEFPCWPFLKQNFLSTQLSAPKYKFHTYIKLAQVCLEVGILMLLILVSPDHSVLVFLLCWIFYLAWAFSSFSKWGLLCSCCVQASHSFGSEPTVAHQALGEKIKVTQSCPTLTPWSVTLRGAWWGHKELDTTE